MRNTMKENISDASNLYKQFSQTSIFALEDRLEKSTDREEKIFLRELINLKLQLAQEKVVGEILL